MSCRLQLNMWFLTDLLSVSFLHVIDRKSSPNILMTSCRDNICRIWAETVPRIKQLTLDQPTTISRQVLYEHNDKKKYSLRSTLHHHLR